MAKGVIERSWDFWTRLLEGKDLIESPPAAYEDVPGIYDVGGVTSDYMRQWLKTSPNHATPAEMLELATTLDEFTQQLEKADEEYRGGVTCWRMNLRHPGYHSICTDLERWRVRLDNYIDTLSAIPVDELENHRSALWEVTAPLFLGWYGGPTGHEVPLPKNGFAPGFNTELQHVADISTPYSIANQLEVEFDWQKERQKRLVDEVAEPFKKTGKNILMYVALGSAAYLAYMLGSNRR